MSEVAFVPLRDVLAESQNGISKRRGDSGSQIAVLRLADISRGIIDESDPREIQLTEKEVDKYALQQGDLVCIRVNGSKNLVGRVVPFSSSRTWAYCDHFIRLRPRHDIVDFRYLAHFFETGHVRRYVELNMVSSAGQNTVSQGTMLDVAVPLPALTVQREIVAEIEKQFSRLDEAVANLQRVKANLKRYKASVLKDAVEGRLVPTEAELARREGRSFEDGEKLLQRAVNGRGVGGKARRRKADVAALPHANLSEIADGWIWTTTGAICECIVPNRDKPKTFSGDIPWLTLPDFDDSEITTARSKSGLGFTASEVALYRAKVIPIDSVVMSCVGRFGISAVLTRKAVINQQLHAFLPSEAVVPKYLAYVLRTRDQEMLQKSTATTIAYLNKENCNSITVPLAPLAEQARIVAEVDRRLSLVRGVESEVDANLKRAQSLRQATLANAFIGRAIQP